MRLASMHRLAGCDASSPLIRNLIVWRYLVYGIHSQASVSFYNVNIYDLTYTSRSHVPIEYVHSPVEAVKQ